MNLNTLLKNTADSQKLCITVDGRHYSGHWYNDNILELLSMYKYQMVDITVENSDMIAATIRRF